MSERNRTDPLMHHPVNRGSASVTFRKDCPESSGLDIAAAYDANDRRRAIVSRIGQGSGDRDCTARFDNKLLLDRQGAYG